MLLQNVAPLCNARAARLPAVHAQEKLIRRLLPFSPLFFIFRFDGKSALKARARLETKHPVELTFTDHLIHRPLAVLTIDLGQDQLGGIGVIKPPKSACTCNNSLALSSVMRESGKNHRKGAETQITNFYVAICLRSAPIR